MFSDSSSQLSLLPCYSETSSHNSHILQRKPRKWKASFFPIPCFMFFYISWQGWMRGQNHPLFCLLPVTHHFTLSCTPKTPNCLNNTAVLVLKWSFKMFYWKILLNSVNPWLVHSIFTSLWVFFIPKPSMFHMPLGLAPGTQIFEDGLRSLFMQGWFD